VLFNRGLSYIYLGDMEQGMDDLEYAVKEKQTEEHNVITEAIKDRAAVPLSQDVTNFRGIPCSRFQ
jgi:hypothetical protein